MTFEKGVSTFSNVIALMVLIRGSYTSFNSNEVKSLDVLLELDFDEQNRVLLLVICV